MTEELIRENINKEVLRGFKTLQKNKNILYTSANGSYLTSVSDKAMIVYTNPKEIDFKGTFKLARNKLIPVEHKLDSTVNTAINLSQFTKLKTFEKNSMMEFQKYCYEENMYVNIADIHGTIEKLFEAYYSFTLYKHDTESEIMLSFSNSIHKTYLLSKLL